MTVQAGAAPQVATASAFVLSIPPLPGIVAAKIVFQELVGLTSAVIPAAPAAAGTAPAGHTQQYGTTTPPTVTLKGGLDSTGALWKWHELALEGSPAARATVTITLENASGQPVTGWLLVNAWCSKIDVSGVVAGGGEVVQTATLVCDRISQTSV